MSFDPFGRGENPWIILLYPNTEDKEAENEAGTLIYHSFNGLDINELLLTGRWVQVPHWLDEYCDLEFSIRAEDEDFFLADGVNVAIRQILVEHLHDDDEPDDQRMRDELFLSLMTHYINAWNANYDIPGVTRRGHDGVCLMSEHCAACFEEL